MNSGIEQAILTVGGSWALSTLAKASLIAAMGLCAAALSGRRRAAVRHAVLAATLGVLLALPVASALAPRIGIAVGRARRARHGEVDAAARRARRCRGGHELRAASRWSMADWLIGASGSPGWSCFCCRRPRGCGRCAGCGGRERRGRGGSRWWTGRVEVLLHETLGRTDDVRGRPTGHRAARRRAGLGCGGPRAGPGSRDGARTRQRLGDPLRGPRGLRLVLVPSSGLDGAAAAGVGGGAGLRRRGARTLGGDGVCRSAGGRGAEAVGGPIADAGDGQSQGPGIAGEGGARRRPTARPGGQVVRDRCRGDVGGDAHRDVAAADRRGAADRGRCARLPSRHAAGRDGGEGVVSERQDGGGPGGGRFRGHRGRRPADARDLRISERRLPRRVLFGTVEGRRPIPQAQRRRQDGHRRQGRAPRRVSLCCRTSGSPRAA